MKTKTYELISEKERLIVELSDEINILKHQIEELEKELTFSLLNEQRIHIETQQLHKKYLETKPKGGLG